MLLAEDGSVPVWFEDAVPGGLGGFNRGQGQDDSPRGLAGISSGSRAAKILRKHATGGVAILSLSPRLSPDFSSRPRRTAANLRGAARLRAERSFFQATWRSSMPINCVSSYVLYSKHTRKNALPLHEKNLSVRPSSLPQTTSARDKKYTSQQAVMERVCDEKSGERRGDHLKITTKLIACFRKIFAAQIPPSPQRDQGGSVLFKLAQ
jgi:hypothetical protein